MLYVVQRTDCARFRLAPDLDPGYASAFDAAREAGVEMMCHGTEISPDGRHAGAARSRSIRPLRRAAAVNGRLTGNRLAKTLAWAKQDDTGDWLWTTSTAA
jgi:hypothetical protein